MSAAFRSFRNMFGDTLLLEPSSEQAGAHASSLFSFSSQVSFNVSVEARSCPPGGADHSFTIKPVGFKDRLEVSVDYQCDCGCSRTAQTNSSICSSIGNLHCPWDVPASHRDRQAVMLPV